MAKRFPFYHPFMLPNGDEEALEQRKIVYEDSPADPDAKYEVNDLVTLATGVCLKEVGTTPANLGPLALAGHDWNQPFAVSDKRDPAATAPFLDNLFVNIIRENSLFVITYQAATADGSDHVSVAADLTAINSHERRELVFNDTEKCLTIRAGVTNPNVIMLAPFDGAEVGDSNIPVLCKFVPEFLAS